MESLREMFHRLELMTKTVVVHPDDLTDEMREEIERTPLTRLKESDLCPRGMIYVIDPKALEVEYLP